MKPYNDVFLQESLSASNLHDTYKHIYIHNILLKHASPQNKTWAGVSNYLENIHSDIKLYLQYIGKRFKNFFLLNV